jgi:hypothetical protein
MVFWSNEQACYNTAGRGSAQLTPHLFFFTTLVCRPVFTVDYNYITVHNCCFNLHKKKFH